MTKFLQYGLWIGIVLLCSGCDSIGNDSDIEKIYRDASDLSMRLVELYSDKVETGNLDSIEEACKNHESCVAVRLYTFRRVFLYGDSSARHKGAIEVLSRIDKDLAYRSYKSEARYFNHFAYNVERVSVSRQNVRVFLVLAANKDKSSVSHLKNAILYKPICRTGLMSRESLDHINRIIEVLEEGETYDPMSDREEVLPSFMHNDIPDCDGLEYIGHRIGEMDDHASLQLVKVLEDIAIHADGFNTYVTKTRSFNPRLVREPTIVQILLKQLESSKDETIRASLDILLNQVPGEVLNRFGQEFIEQLKNTGASGYLKLIAKAKPENSLNIVRNILRERGIENGTTSRLALAALGDVEIEKDLIEDFLNEQDPMEKATKGAIMSQVGTPATLRALASEMRTHLVQDVPMVEQRSIRILILRLLQRGFPMEEAFYRTIESDRDYLEIEQFIENELGVTWKVSKR